MHVVPVDLPLCVHLKTHQWNEASEGDCTNSMLTSG